MSPTPRAAAAYAASRPMLPGAKWQPNAVKTSALHRATMRGMIPRDLFQVFGSILQSGRLRRDSSSVGKANGSLVLTKILDRILGRWFGWFAQRAPKLE